MTINNKTTLTAEEREVLQRIRQKYAWIYRSAEGEIRFFGYQAVDDKEADIKQINQEAKTLFTFLPNGSSMVNIKSLLEVCS